ncbi:dihydrolipoyl dehydrogenase family protein [Sandaracinus amylolyticus]|uniref:Glutathione reductase n=1 Tax=Sandaracinus amylolyticus TaxID=927083 RepID=A0A0F6W0N3_9BACT|nr:NAD(P)/FAD-dependent oxidoreductase [Sandaracinus amylolyticus]AKF04487.1 Glutathione reductase [Sandaracinus amylolyticus]
MPSAFDVVVIGAGPAGAVAALRAADLGARTALVARDRFGGMAANDGPVPVRTLAHAARLVREARQLDRYGICAGEPVVDYPRLLARVREVVDHVGRESALRGQCESAGVVIHENAGAARFVAPHTIETANGLRLDAESIVLCTGGTNRRLSVPGVELTSTHSDAWALTSVPPSMLVIGAGATGVQVASIFHAFGTHVQLFQAGARILPTEDEDVAAEVTDAFRAAGITVRTDFGVIESFEKTASGLRMIVSRDGDRSTAEAALAVVAIGWVANTAELGLDVAGVAADERGRVRVDDYLRTSAPHVFAAGDVTGHLMLVPQALEEGYVAGTNAVRGAVLPRTEHVSPIGSFTDPEYAQVGLGEAQARAELDALVTVIRLDAGTRAIIDGRTSGFCKLIVDRTTSRVVGCHVVGDRAVDIVQLAAIAISAGMTVDELARVPFSFPTYAGVLGRAATTAARTLRRDRAWRAPDVE